MKVCPRSHRHPNLRRPVAPERLLDETVRLARRMGLEHVVAGIRFPQDELHAAHARDPRRYAEVRGLDGLIYFATATLWLPRPQREGLIAHEIGHLVNLPWPHTERVADETAEAALGRRITYDKRWGGRGLQTLR